MQTSSKQSGACRQWRMCCAQYQRIDGVAHEGFFKVADDKYQPGTPIVVRPRRQTRDRVKGVLHGMNGARQGFARDVDDTFDAQ